MVIREMTFDDIAEVAELERLYSQTPWDATGIFSWWMRDDTLFLVAGEELAEPAERIEEISRKKDEETFVGNSDGSSGAERKETFAGNSDESSGSAGATDDEEDYIPPVVYGYVGLVMVPYESDITNITVSGECRRQGIATALLEELFRRCPEKGVTVIHLEVRESNAPARALYEKHGFIIDGRRKNYYTDPAEDAILMTKTLSGDNN